MKPTSLFEELDRIFGRPAPFSAYTTPEFWNDPHISKGLLAAHLEPLHDLASFNHAFLRRAVDWMTGRLSIGTGVRVCDFGCGPGLYTTAFAERGATVTGVDVSERSLAHAQAVARAKRLHVKYVQQNYLAYEPAGPFDVIVMIYRDFSVLSPAQSKQLLSVFHNSLVEGGRVLLDVDAIPCFEKARECSLIEENPQGGFWSPRPHYVITNQYKYEEEKLLLEKYVLIGADGMRTLYNWHQCYDRETLERLFREAGFRVDGVYSSVAGDPEEADSTVLAVVAEKAG